MMQSPLKPDDMFYQKQKLTRLSQKFFTLCYIFYFTFFYRTFFKTVGELLHLLTVHTKLIFQSALQKALVVEEKRDCGTGALRTPFLAEHLWWLLLFSSPEIALETTYFMLFVKNLNENLEKKLVIMFVSMEQINFSNISFFCMLHLLLLRKTPQSSMAGEKLCL